MRLTHHFNNITVTSNDRVRKDLLKCIKADYEHEWRKDEKGMGVNWEHLYDEVLKSNIMDMIEMMLNAYDFGDLKHLYVKFMKGKTLQTKASSVTKSRAYKSCTRGSMVGIGSSYQRNVTRSATIEVNMGSIIVADFIMKHNGFGVPLQKAYQGMLEMTMETIAHEMIHVQQHFTKGFCYADGYFHWNDEQYMHINKFKGLSHKAYKAVPWEEEAFRRGRAICEGFLIRKRIKEDGYIPSELYGFTSCESNETHA